MTSPVSEDLSKKAKFARFTLSKIWLNSLDTFHYSRAAMSWFPVNVDYCTRSVSQGTRIIYGFKRWEISASPPPTTTEGD